MRPHIVRIGMGAMLAAAVALGAFTAPAQDPTAGWKLPPDAAALPNPIPATPESIARGRELFAAAKCVFCHGVDGKGNSENLAKLRRRPADLTDAERVGRNTDGELFWKISLGIPQIMPAGKTRLTEEERWHVVNFVRSLAKSGHTRTWTLANQAAVNKVFSRSTRTFSGLVL